tara:strand:+ start:369696 stop:370883 length:1188 start_codon:yes stop_codon:yes gene_type:complete
MMKKLIYTAGFLVSLLVFTGDSSAQDNVALDQLIAQKEQTVLEKAYTYAHDEEAKLEIVAELDVRPANIAVSGSQRIFLTIHPFENYKYTVVELMDDGTLKPYPNEAWSSKPDKQGKGMTAAIGISVTFEDEMFVLDMGSAQHQAKIFAWDMINNEIADVYYIPNHVTTPQSFFQDISFDWAKKFFFVADMGQADFTKAARPALITLGQLNGYARRLLDSHPALMPPEQPVTVGGKVLKLKDGTPIRAGFNPMTILPLRNWLYLAPMGRGMVYKIRTYHLIDEDLSEEELSEKLVPIGEKPASDGMTIDAVGNIYITDLEQGAIGVMDKHGEYSVYLKDERIKWADGFSFGADGYLYVTLNQLHKAAPLNGGKEEGKPPYYIARFKPLAAGSISR